MCLCAIYRGERLPRPLFLPAILPLVPFPHQGNPSPPPIQTIQLQVRIWDYQTKACVQVLEGHTHNVSAVLFHPRLPILVSGSEDGTVRPCIHCLLSLLLHVYGCTCTCVYA